MLAAGGLAEVAGPGRVEELRSAIVQSLAPSRTPDGGYRLENKWRYLVARA